MSDENQEGANKINILDANEKHALEVACKAAGIGKAAEYLSELGITLETLSIIEVDKLPFIINAHKTEKEKFVGDVMQKQLKKLQTNIKEEESIILTGKRYGIWKENKATIVSINYYGTLKEDFKINEMKNNDVSHTTSQTIESITPNVDNILGNESYLKSSILNFGKLTEFKASNFAQQLLQGQINKIPDFCSIHLVKKALQTTVAGCIKITTAQDVITYKFCLGCLSIKKGIPQHCPNCLKYIEIIPKLEDKSYKVGIHSLPVIWETVNLKNLTKKWSMFYNILI